MRTFQLLTWTVLAALIFTAFSPVHAHGRPFVSVGIGVGGPFYGPCWGWGPWGYYRPYPYYYGGVYVPPPVIYASPPPVVVQPAVVTAPATTVAPPTYRAQAPSSDYISTTSASGSNQNLQNLSSPDENIRQSAVMDLGRSRVDAAVDPLCATLAGDSSPAVRDAAARALGLIAAPRSLPALIRAAQADKDRDVRHSAQFAVEIIRTNLRNR